MQSIERWILLMRQSGMIFNAASSDDIITSARNSSIELIYWFPLVPYAIALEWNRIYSFN